MVVNTIKTDCSQIMYACERVYEINSGLTKRERLCLILLKNYSVQMAIESLQQASVSAKLTSSKNQGKR